MQELSQVVLELLRNKGITSEEDIAEYISPAPKRTYSPFLMLNMREGVNLVLKCISDGGRICIYGDYDADGITSVAIMMQTLSLLTDNLFYYIPSRFDEGYGLNMDAVKTIRDQGTDLIITVDCGCVSVDEVAYAKELGMDILVTDHHNMDERAADCLIINPKQEGCNYPFKGLAGCGVAFKLCCAIQQTAGLDKQIVRDILDLVAIGTVGDIVPLVDENRTLVKYGLKALKSSRRAGLVKLFESLGLEQAKADEGNIAYIIVPHLNAAGRMANASLGAKLLLEGKEELVRQLIWVNKERKKVQSETYDKCLDEAENQSKKRNSIIIRCDEAHEGITGIVAGKLKEKYHKPVVIVTPVEGGLKGTGRSISGVDLYGLLKDSSEYFTKFGGHRMACGFTIKEEFYEAFFNEVEERLAGLIADDSEIMNDELTVDMNLSVSDVDMSLMEDLELLSPYGHDNEKPVFKISDVKILEKFYMGSDSSHVRFTVCNSSGRMLKCVLFGRAAEFEKELNSIDEISLIGTLEISSWKNRVNPQMIISDIHMK